MTAPTDEYVWLSFQLVVDDGWPPVSSESIPFIPRSEGFECATVPLYVKNLSVGDVISTEPDDQGRVWTWQHVSHSKHSTVWLLRLASPHGIDQVLEDLQALGCSTAALPQFGSYAVDVPGSVLLTEVEERLDRIDPETVARAYPSLRHSDE